MSYPITGNVSLGNVSGNIKLYVNDSGSGNLTGFGYNNNCMTFSVNQSVTDTPEVVINQFGNVGIGTQTPRFTFDVNGIIATNNDINNKKLVLYDNAPTDNPNTATNFYGFGINAGMLRYQVDTDAATHAFYGGSTEYMRIVAGNMGIGTTNPQARLDVTSTGQNAVTIEVGDVSNTNVLRLIGNLTTGGFNNISQSNDVGIIYGTSAGSLTNKLVIAPWATGPSGIRMDQNGNVGIGTTNPHTELDVNGILRLNNPITQTFTAYSAGTTPSSTQIGYSQTTTGTYPTAIPAAFNALSNTQTGVSIPTAGVWLINYNGVLHITSATLTSGNIAFGLSFTTSNAGNTVLISTSRSPIVSSGYTTTLSSFSLQGSYVYTGASTTFYLNCNVSTITGLAARPCSVTVTRIA